MHNFHMMWGNLNLAANYENFVIFIISFLFHFVAFHFIGGGSSFPFQFAKIMKDQASFLNFHFQLDFSVLYLNFISLAKFYICFSDIKVCWFLSEFFILFKDICIRYAYQTGKSTIYLDYIPPSLLYICVRVCVSGWWQSNIYHAKFQLFIYHNLSSSFVIVVQLHLLISWDKAKMY